MGKPVEQGLYLAALGAFSDGMNSDVPPVALPPTQLSYALNCTMRGNYVTYRPPYRDVELSFTGDIQEDFEGGLFQGASYYKPDFGGESIVTSIGGRLYRITPGGAATATVEDVSISDDLNSETSPQSWLWQGENYLFCNNGLSQPLIYDGNASFRSDAGTVVGTTSGAAVLPAVGVPVGVTLTSNYTGPLGYPLYLYPSQAAADAGQYLLAQAQVSIVPSGGFKCLLENVDDTPGASHADGTDIMSVAGAPLTLSKQTTIFAGSYSNLTSLLGLTAPYNSPGTVTVTDNNGLAWTFPINQAGSRTVAGVFYLGITVNGTYPTMVFAVGQQVFPGGGISVPVATLEGEFIAGAIGVQKEATIEENYTGVDGQPVTIDGKNYKIYASPYTPTASIYLTPTQNYVDEGSSIPSGSVLKTIPQLPISTIGVYGLGRNWVALPDRTSYLASDIVGGSSGTAANKFRDSILNVTENNYLAGGGVFRVPASGQQINSMAFPATLDSSLGQGPLQVLTQDITFSCNAPIQRDTWQFLTNPIQTQSLVGGGALGDVVPVNGDLWFRSADGIRSLRLARQDFVISYSNTPQSVEMNRVLMEDNQALLNFWNGVVFDNRLLSTASPQTSRGGVYHPKLIALNLDPNSSLRGKQAPFYDGAWQDKNVLKLIVGTFGGITRAFALTYDITNSKIGLTEILPTKPENNFDNGDERIQWSFETPAVFYEPDTRKRELLQLSDGEMFVKDIVGTVQIKVEFRPDYSSTWTTWHEWEIPASPTYQQRMGFGTPPITGDATTNRPFKVGYSFQLRVTILGACTVMGMNLFATTQPVTSIAPPIRSTGLTSLTP